MDRYSPSSRERRLADELRTLREAAGLTGKDAADRLGWSPSKVSRIESARVGISAEDLARSLELYDASPAQAERLSRTAESARSKGWWEPFADLLTADYTNLIRLEAGSRAVDAYCAVVPHALLQTPGYAETVICSSRAKPSDLEFQRRVDMHRRRQNLLREDGQVRFSAVIDESVFHRLLPDPAVLRAQFTRLAELAEWPNVRIQVLPFGAGLPPVTAGSFCILESEATGLADVVYLENKTRAFFVDAEREVYLYTQDYTMLQEMALPPDESLDYMRRAAASVGSA
ncbi:transcriptional regulator [Virgisporangium aliadipatigenens]|uniref:Transcriptional regulator n=1 Tax=Virgisporangium aliadipatigenens TaxID=741659 RepID=A0A8J3YG07_9ACTN|nr:helix-turn-helix transcriptional regulator [Virgisporangium aliadipatigenens]GIJ44341.1 transcriptional regulator [Virgisporangium aliadipatigenens]